MEKTEPVLLALDLSTTCTGYAVFGIDSKKLLACGKIRGKDVKGPHKYLNLLNKMRNLACQVAELVKQYSPTTIVIEEIAGSKNRLGQKTLDMFHLMVWISIEEYLPIVKYQDVTGADGWRTWLKLKLSDADKHANKEAKTLNKKLTGSQKLPIIGPKHLACRYANATYGTCLNVDTSPTDGDIADAIGVGSAFLIFRFPEVLR